MAQLAIPAAGAALGWYIGGSNGAALGWALGSSYVASKQTINQDMIGDLRVQTSTYGTIIPFVTGVQRLAGNVIWASDKTTYTTTSGGKGSGPSVTTTGYKISMAIALCAGPIRGISRVWEDGQLKANATSSQGKLPGVLYLGDDTQNPDPTIEAHEGVGNVPAYRGLAYIVLTDFDLGPSGRVPMFSFEVVTDQALGSSNPVPILPSDWYSWNGTHDTSYSSATTLTSQINYDNLAMLSDTIGIMANSDGSVIKVQAVQRSGTTVTFGTEFTVQASGYAAPQIYRLSATKAILVYRPNAPTYVAYAQPITYNSMTSLTIGTASAINSTNPCWVRDVVALDDTHFIVAYEDTSSGQVGKLKGASVSTSISWGTAVDNGTDAAYQAGLAKVSATAGVWTRQKTTTTHTIQYFTFNPTGNVITLGTEYNTGLSDDATWNQVELNATSTAGACCYTKDTAVPGKVYVTPFSISGSAITLGTNTALSVANSQWTGDVAYIGSVGSTDYYATIFRDATDTTLGKIKIFKMDATTRVVDTTGPELTTIDSVAVLSSGLTVKKSGDYLLSVFSDNGTKKVRLHTPK